jgi:hypothetical protein
VRGKVYAVLGSAFLVVSIVLAVAAMQVPGGEYPIEVKVACHRMQEVMGETVWAPSEGEEVVVEAYLDWNPNSRAPLDRNVLTTDANGVAIGTVTVDRPGEYTIWISWEGETEGRIVELDPEDEGVTQYVGVEFHMGWDPWGGGF